MNIKNELEEIKEKLKYFSFEDFSFITKKFINLEFHYNNIILESEKIKISQGLNGIIEEYCEIFIEDKWYDISCLFNKIEYIEFSKKFFEEFMILREEINRILYGIFIQNDLMKHQYEDKLLNYIEMLENRTFNSIDAITNELFIQVGVGRVVLREAITSENDMGLLGTVFSTQGLRNEILIAYDKDNENNFHITECYLLS